MGFLDTLFGTAEIDTNLAGTMNQQWGDFRELHKKTWALEGNKQALEGSLRHLGRAEDLYESEYDFSADLVQASRKRVYDDQFAQDIAMGLTGANRQASAAGMLSQARSADRGASISRNLQLQQGIAGALDMLRSTVTSIGPDVNQYMGQLAQMEIAQAQIEQSQGNAIWGAIGAAAGGWAMGGFGSLVSETVGSQFMMGMGGPFGGMAMQNPGYPKEMADYFAGGGL